MLFFLLKWVLSFINIVICLLFFVVVIRVLIMGEFFEVWYRVILMVNIWGL